MSLSGTFVLLLSVDSSSETNKRKLLDDQFVVKNACQGIQKPRIKN